MDEERKVEAPSPESSAQEEEPQTPEPPAETEAATPPELTAEEAPGPEVLTTQPPQPPQRKGISLFVLGIVGGLLFLMLFVLLFALFFAYRNTNQELNALREEMNNRFQVVDSQWQNLSAQNRHQDELIGNASKEIKDLEDEVATLQETLNSRSQTWEEEAQKLEERIKTAEEKLQRRLDQLETSLHEEWKQSLAETRSALESEIKRLRLEVLLMRALRQALEARIHLREKSTGLAKRDLRDVGKLLAQAASVAEDEQTREDIQRLQQSIREIRESLEREVFPVTTVELFMDRLDELIQRVESPPKSH